jgi:hypothetical protein
MAIRAKLEDGTGAIGDLPDIQMQDGKMSEQTALRVSSKIKEIIRRINNGWSLGSGVHAHKAGNVDAQFMDILTPSPANTEFEVPHGLLRKPIGYWVVRRDKAVTVYDSSTGSWTDKFLYLKADQASATIRLLVF